MKLKFAQEYIGQGRDGRYYWIPQGSIAEVASDRAAKAGPDGPDADSLPDLVVVNVVVPALAVKANKWTALEAMTTVNIDEVPSQDDQGRPILVAA